MATHIVYRPLDVIDISDEIDKLMTSDVSMTSVNTETVYRGRICSQKYALAFVELLSYRERRIDINIDINLIGEHPLKGFDLIDNQMVIGGGSVIESIMGDEYHKDIDIFLYGHTEISATQAIINLCKHLKANTITRNKNCINFYFDDESPYVQVILKIFNSKEDILKSIDLGSSQFIYDGVEILTTPLGNFAIKYGLNIIDNRKVLSTYEERIVKYIEKGFGLVFYGIEKQKVLLAKTLSLRGINIYICKMGHCLSIPGNITEKEMTIKLNHRDDLYPCVYYIDACYKKIQYEMIKHINNNRRDLITLMSYQQTIDDQIQFIINGQDIDDKSIDKFVSSVNILKMSVEDMCGIFTGVQVVNIINTIGLGTNVEERLKTLLFEIISNNKSAFNISIAFNAYKISPEVVSFEDYYQHLK